MKKSELRKLRQLNATPGMTTAMRRDENCTLFARAQNLGGILKFAFFKRHWLNEGIKTPVCETFVNTEGKQWISRILDKTGVEIKWTPAMFGNLPLFSGWRNTSWVTPDTFDTLRRLIQNKYKYDRGDCLWLLQRWQEDIRREKIEEQEKKEKKAWDEDLKIVPRTPKGLGLWMHKECNDTFFLIYDYKPGQKMAFCSRCLRLVKVDGLKNERPGECPKCHASAVCKPSGRMQTQGTGWYYGRVVQKIKGGIIERTFSQHELYRDRDYHRPGVWQDEEERIIIPEDGKPRRYYWGRYKNKEMRWCLDKDWKPEHYRTYGDRHSAKIYPPTMKEAKKSPILQKSSFGYWKDPPLNLTEFLVVEKGNPAVEMLGKIKMFDLAEDLITSHYEKDLLCESATELAKMLKIDNMRLKRLRAMKKAGLAELKWMQREKASDQIWPDDLIADFGQAGLTPKELAFLPHHALSEIQIWNYVKKQSKMSRETLWQTVRTWDDYLSMAGSMKMDTRNMMILKPKDLKYAHDELVIMINTKGIEKETEKIEKKFPKVNENLPKLAKFEFKDKKYCIVAPKAVSDIVSEGRILQHCVHTCEYYFSRISTDETYLFFLRRMDHPEMPWYTLEVEPSGNIRQKRTTGDRQNKDFDDALPFLKKWQKYFKKQLTEEEKELGVKADELRKKEYQQLRIDENRIWHGPLAGQLLADVLEADFMEAI
jgi:hypothetical protein